MTQQEFTEFFGSLTNEMASMLLKKGNDYAADDDRLDNFKNAGAVCGLSPEQTCLNLMAVKINRMANLLNTGKTPNNESIKDTAIDLACYAVLLNAILHDAHNNGKHISGTLVQNDVDAAKDDETADAIETKMNKLDIEFSCKSLGWKRAALANACGFMSSAWTESYCQIRFERLAYDEKMKLMLMETASKDDGNGEEEEEEDLYSAVSDFRNATDKVKTFFKSVPLEEKKVILRYHYKDLNPDLDEQYYIEVFNALSLAIKRDIIQKHLEQ